MISHALAERLRAGIALGPSPADLPPTAPGQWAYRWECVAPHAGAAEGVITS